MNAAGTTGRRTRSRTARRGVVLVAVVALLALSGALIAGAFAAARGVVRTTRSSRAGVIADGAARRAIARTLASWTPADDSLGVGTFVSRTFDDAAAAPLDSAESRVRVQRISSTLFVVAVEASVPSSAAPIARRRARVLLERAPTIDSSVVSPLRPIPQWSNADLF